MVAVLKRSAAYKAANGLKCGFVQLWTALCRYACSKRLKRGPASTPALFLIGSRASMPLTADGRSRRG